MGLVTVLVTRIVGTVRAMVAVVTAEVMTTMGKAVALEAVAAM